MNKPLLLIPLLFFTSLRADKERERWEREIREKEQQQRELRSVYYRVATASGIASFVGGSLRRLDILLYTGQTW